MTDSRERMSAALSCEGLTVRYGGLCAVDEVSFEIPRGSIVGLIGPNGSGKSSLLDAISRMTPISEGRLTFEGIDYTRFSPDRVAQMGIARTFQSVRLLPGMSVLENVKLGADMGKGRTLGVDWWLGRRKARDMERGSITAAEDSINAVGLTDLIATSAGELSYGLQRLVEIARCLAMHPKVILLDEPTAGMPEGERDQVSSVISSVCAAGVTVVLVEHNVRMISQVSTEVIVLHLGACIARGTANDVLAQPDVRTAFLGNSGDEGLVQVDA